MAEINKKSLEHLADLARLELHVSEEERFLKDLSKILDHFKELESVDTKDVLPMAGGTSLKNIFREDSVFEKDHYDNSGKIVAEFPDQEKSFLKIPPVFD